MNIEISIGTILISACVANIVASENLVTATIAMCAFASGLMIRGGFSDLIKSKDGK